jgi:hypothetical protein
MGGGFAGGRGFQGKQFGGGRIGAGRQTRRGFGRGRGFYDYGYANDCPAYSPYYRRNPWDCSW